MTYNAAGIEGKRPRGGEVWARRYDDGQIVWAKVLVRRTTFSLLSRRKRSKLADGEDKASLVIYTTKDACLGSLHEEEFLEAYPIYMGTIKQLTKQTP